MTRNLMLFFIGLCSCGEQERHIIEPGPYTRAEVRRLLDQVAEVVKPRFPTFRSDVEDFGYDIRSTPTTWCKESGCATYGIVGGKIEFMPGKGVCIAHTQLPHELLHLVVYIYTLKGEHKEPGLWGNSDPSSFEGQLYQLAMKDCQPMNVP
jgi:hypothetical protein